MNTDNSWKCPICGRLVTSNNHICHEQTTPQTNTGLPGWICSKCGASNSPYKMRCDCTPMKLTC